MIDIPCVIFAGGKSSRMGEDKALLPFGEYKTLTQYQYHRLQKIFSDVYISCKDSSKFDFPANFIEDKPDNTVFAPTSGFISMFENLQFNSFFVLGVDIPFITENEINKIINSNRNNNDATVAKTSDGIQALCGIYHRSILESLFHNYQQDNHKLSYLLENSNTSYVDFADTKPFFNLNKPDDYKEALQLI